MRVSLKRSYFVFFSLFVSLLLSNTSYAATGVDWLSSIQNTNGSYVTSTDVSTTIQSTAETLTTFNALQELSQSGLPVALDFINSNNYLNTENLSRQIIANAVIGADVTSFIVNLLEAQNFDGGFGEFSGYDSTALDTAFALQAMSAASISGAEVSWAIDFLIGKQKLDGGFALGDANDSSVYCTAMASIALQQYRFNFSVGDLINSASDFLLQNKVADDWGTNWETAHALLALVPVITDTSQYVSAVESLRTNQSTSGSWDNDVYTTALVLRSLHLADNIEFPVDPTTAIFGGRIINDVTGAPLAAVQVSTDPSTGGQATTDTDGEFTLLNVPPDRYSVHYEAAGYSSAVQTVSVVAGQLANLGTVRLTPSPTVGVVSGTIADSSTGLPLAGVLVELSGVTTASVTTDTAGFFTSISAPGNIIITASKPGYDASSGSAALLAGSVLNFSPALNPAGTTSRDPNVVVIGSIMDLDTNAPISGATITVKNTVVSTLSAIDGSFTLSSVTAGELNLEVSKDGYQTQDFTTIAPVSSTVDLGVVLLSNNNPVTTSIVIGVVTDIATEQPVPGAVVSVQGTGLSTTTAADGTYRIEGIVELSFVVKTNATGYIGGFREISLVQPQLLQTNILLQPAIVGGFSISLLKPTQLSYGAYEKIILDAAFTNNGTLTKAVELMMTVRNSEGVAVEQLAAAHSPLPNDIADSILSVNAGAVVNTQFEWMNRALAPGVYEITLEAFDLGNRQLMGQRSITVLVEPSLSVSSMTITPNPQFTNVGAIEQVSFTASLTNRSNISSNLIFVYRWLDSVGSLIAEGTIEVPLNPDEVMADIVFGSQQYEFVASGEYALEVEIISGALPGNLTAVPVTVAPTVHINPSQGIGPEAVVPDGDKRIRLEIRLQGRNQG